MSRSGGRPDPQPRLAAGLILRNRGGAGLLVGAMPLPARGDHPGEGPAAGASRGVGRGRARDGTPAPDFGLGRASAARLPEVGALWQSRSRVVRASKIGGCAASGGNVAKMSNATNPRARPGVWGTMAVGGVSGSLLGPGGPKAGDERYREPKRLGGGPQRYTAGEGQLWGVGVAVGGHGGPWSGACCGPADRLPRFAGSVEAG